MNIALFGTRMDLISGHSRPAYELAGRLISRGHTVRIVSTALSADRQRSHTALRQRESHLGIPPTERPFASLRSILRNPQRARAYFSELFSWADVLHFFSLLGGSIALKLAPSPKPAVLALNTMFRSAFRDHWGDGRSPLASLRRPRFLFSLAYPAFGFRSLIRSFDRVVSFSEFMVREALTAGVPAESIARVPMGLDLRRFRPEDRTFDPSAPAFLFFGMLSPFRGSLTLLSAFSRVLDSLPRARLIVADRGPHQTSDRRGHSDEERLFSRTIHGHGLDSSVIRMGFEPDISNVINACDAVVLPFSTAYGYSQPPLTVLEALAHGKPVITTSVGSIPELIVEGSLGKLLGSDDIPALAQAMIDLPALLTPDRSLLRKKLIVERHDWEPVVDRILQEYTALMGLKARD